MGVLMSKALDQFAASAGGPIGVAIAVIGVVGTIYVIWGNDLKKAAAAAANAVNPTSDKNLAYTGVNAVGTALTGDESFSLGGWFYDLTHKAYDPNADYRTPEYAPRSAQVREEAAWYERLLGY